MGEDAAILTSGQVAQMMGISSQTVRQLTHRGVLPCEFTHGGHRRYCISDVLALMRENDELWRVRPSGNSDGDNWVWECSDEGEEEFDAVPAR